MNSGVAAPPRCPLPDPYRCMAEGGETKRKRGTELDWNKLHIENDDENLSIHLIGKGFEKPKQIEKPMVEGDSPPVTDLSFYNDIQLADSIQNSKGMMNLNLPDGGEKLRNRLKALENELNRRKLLKGDGKGDVIPLDDSSSHDARDDHPNGASHSETASKSDFANYFVRKLDENKTSKSFSGELSSLNSHQNGNEHFANARTRITSLPSKSTPFKSPWHSSKQSQSSCPSKKSQISCQEKKKLSSARRSKSPPDLFPKNIIDYFGKREDTSQSGCSRRSTGKNQSVVVLDEEELDLHMNYQACEDGPSCKTSTIYYPSRDDPEAVEIQRSELETLAPEAYLSSTIMNFYIEYLQKKASVEAINITDYHFFNTYFYEKLKRDVLNKADKEAAFEKFRRWWKGINLFEKAYIFLPICECDHWSLVIICIPSKGSGEGPLMLHLDSLGYHASTSIFRDVKSFLIQEWKCLYQEMPPNAIATHIWEKLPRRIGEKVVKVPQQENSYDCGLFVLYFLELFIRVAPERLKRDDCDMFGSNWFRPEDASRLRVRIKKLLLEEFNMQSKELIETSATKIS